MNRKKYTNEFKEETVKLIIEQGYTQAEASRNLGISDTNINRWLKGAGTSTVKTKPTTEQAELIRLKKENQQLRLEREILKKAAAFFANEIK